MRCPHCLTEITDKEEIAQQCCKDCRFADPGSAEDVDERMDRVTLVMIEVLKDMLEEKEK